MVTVHNMVHNILIKIDVLPTLKERVAQKKTDLIKEEILRNRGYLDQVTKQKLEAHKKADENTAKLLSKDGEGE